MRADWVAHSKHPRRYNFQRHNFQRHKARSAANQAAAPAAAARPRGLFGFAFAFAVVDGGEQLIDGLVQRDSLGIRERQ